MQTIYSVTLYPFDDGTPDEVLFADQNEAEAFARFINQLPDEQANYLAGGEAAVTVKTRYTVSLAGARQAVNQLLQEGI